MSIDSFDGLPEPLDVIADAAGLDAALKLADAYGGTRVSIPARVSDDHWLAQLVGLEAAKAICKEMAQISAGGRMRGAGEIVIPRGPANHYAKAKAQFYQHRKEGLSVRKAARMVQVHEQTGFRWEKSRKADDNQLFLF
jgi:hypothetical protein